MRLPLLLNEWTGVSLDDILHRFGLSFSELGGTEVLLASYSRDPLGGEAFLLIRKGGRLFEINASHDSSGDMRGQWEPEETMSEALTYRMTFGRLGRSEDGRDLFATALEKLLEALEDRGKPV